jgi:type II secretory pathway pseudopilin PulG
MRKAFEGQSMTQRQIIRRIRARTGQDGGFTILETVIAMTVIFASLTALMYTATSGFRYIGLARERQAATGAATRLMEQIHALSVDTITTGMETSDLTGDPKIKTPADCGDGEYHFETCAGEEIVHTTGAPVAVPLNPHTGTLAAPEYPTTFTWATYVTNSDTSNDPYRITVIVSWPDGAVGGAAKFVQVQNLWSSPKGCSATPLIHPFAGPCQPYFTGTASAAQGTVAITGTVNGASITDAAPTLFGPQAESRISAEQVSQVQASVTQSGASTSSTTRGLVTLSIAADGNPTTSTSDYSPTGSPPAALAPTYGSAIAVTASPVAMSLSGGSSGDSGSATTADAATSTTKCPSPSGPWPASQSDGFPCGWARGIRGATVSATVNTTKLLGTTTASAGQLTLAQLSGTATLDTWADRVIPAGTTGTLTMTGQRSVGTMELLGIPAKFLAANVANDTNTASTITTLSNLQSCTGGNYAVRATAGTATAATTTGLSASNPSASWSGANVRLYTGSGCTTYGSASLNGSVAQQPTVPGFTLQRYVRPGGSNHNCITYRVTPVTGSGLQFGGVTTTKLPTLGTTLTDATATVNPMIQGQARVELIYETNQNNSCTAAAAIKETVIDVTLTISLGGLTSRAQYIAPPTGG